MNEPTRIDDLASVRFDFEQWRRTRTGRARIPEPLWRAAIDLVRHYPAARVARELGLSPSLLHRRLRAERNAEDGSSPTPHRFVEIAPRALVQIDRSRPAAEARRFAETPVSLTLERADGARLLLSVPSADWNRVEAICSAFLSGR
jgi:hypothetical protein